MSAPRRPILRYHGGKWKLAPWVIAHIPAHLRYVEPFCGAASVLMRKSRAPSEVINDLDDDVVNVFRVLRDPAQADELRRLVELTPWARAEFAAAYEPTEDPVERARRLLVRSFMGYGACGHNADARTGFRNAGWRDSAIPANKDWCTYPAAIPAFVERLRGVVIENRPALDLIGIYDDPRTLIYVDPPYVLSTRTAHAQGNKGYRHEMTDDDHAALAERLHAATGMVIISGYDCPLYRDLYASWRMETRSHFADQAKPRKECLWISPRAAAALRGNLLEVGT